MYHNVSAYILAFVKCMCEMQVMHWHIVCAQNIWQNSMEEKHANKFKVDGEGVYFVLTSVCVGKVSPADAKERQKVCWTEYNWE